LLIIAEVSDLSRGFLKKHRKFLGEYPVGAAPLDMPPLAAGRKTW
jgi:hypothetical protein